MLPYWQANASKIACALVALGAIVGGAFYPGLLGLWVAVLGLAGMGWRTTTAYMLAAGIAGAAVVAVLLLQTGLGADARDLHTALGCLLTLGISAWAGWLYLSAAQKRRHAIRQVIEDLGEDLAKLRENVQAGEKTLTVHENRRKRYSRLQESATAMSSSLELEKLAEITLAQAANLLRDLPLNLSLFLMDPQGKEVIRRSIDQNGGAPYPETLPAGEDALNAWVLARGTSLVIKDLERDFRFRGLDMKVLKGRSFHLSPLLSTQGQVIGLVRAESASREAMDQEDGRLLESLVVLAGLAMENAKLYRETQDLAVTDGLTKLLLRRVLLEKLELELVRTAEKGGQVALLIVDIDHFKAVNDTYGHPVGDSVLREVAARIKRCVRDVDVCGRYGGEEFVVMLPQTPQAGAQLVAERIREAVKGRSFEMRGEERNVTLSVGVSVFPDHAGDSRALIEAADNALYRAKQGGRDRVEMAGGEP
jgi:diguanylate cyclase (GGDEF)-like protein